MLSLSCTRFLFEFLKLNSNVSTTILTMCILMTWLCGRNVRIHEFNLRIRIEILRKKDPAYGLNAFLYNYCVSPFIVLLCFKIFYVTNPITLEFILSAKLYHLVSILINFRLLTFYINLYLQFKQYLIDFKIFEL